MENQGSKSKIFLFFMVRFQNHEYGCTCGPDEDNCQHPETLGHKPMTGWDLGFFFWGS